MEEGIGRGIITGIIAGAVCGVGMIALNHITGAFNFESSLRHNLAAFAIGGALFGILSGGIVSLVSGYLPFGKVANAVIVSVVVWTLLRTVGAGLAGLDPFRFHSDISQTYQGLGFSILLGVVLGFALKSGGRKTA